MNTEERKDHYETCDCDDCVFQGRTCAMHRRADKQCDNFVSYTLRDKVKANLKNEIFERSLSKVDPKIKDEVIRNMDMTIIGIDPGLKGGIAVYSNGEMMVYGMPDGFTGIFDALETIHSAHKPCIAILEDVGKGIPGQSSKATATFARHNGHLEMALYALGMRSVKVTPQKWQKYYSNTIGNSKGKTKTEWKNILKNEAKRRYPELKISLNTADAVLIAEYGRTMI